MARRKLHYQEISRLAPLLRAGKLSPVDLTEAILERVEKLDPCLHAYARVTADEARAAARAAEASIRRRDYLGPLHGIPLAVKDLFWTQGVVTAAGTTVHGDFVPAEDSTVVRRLRDAGAIILGKLQMTEGAFATHHPTIAPPVNPWGADHWTGASSSGSGVATAAGLCCASLGTDTGGSIRFPCAANGLTGLKPTWGRVSRHGTFELAAFLDHVGPIARSAADARILFNAIEGHDPLDPTSDSPQPRGRVRAVALKGLTVGVDPYWNSNGTDDATQRVLENVLATLRNLGADVREVRFPDAWHIAGQWEAQCGVQTAVAHADTYPARAAEYGPALSRLIDVGRSLEGSAYQRLLLSAAAFTGRVNALLERIDLLLVPVQPIAAPTHDQLGALAADPEANQRLIQFTAPFNISGHPALSLPGGHSPEGLPIGFQLVARKGGEQTLLGAGVALQRVTDWHRAHPAC